MFTAVSASNATNPRITQFLYFTMSKRNAVYEAPDANPYEC